jgi:hypothetical protein
MASTYTYLPTTHSRPLLSFAITQPRNLYGQHVSFADVDGSDRNGSSEGSDYPRQIIPDYTVERLILHGGFQAHAETKERGTQTEWRPKTNAASQYSPKVFPEEKCQEIMNSPELQEFLISSLEVLETELTKNENFDCFQDDLQPSAEDGAQISRHTMTSNSALYIKKLDKAFDTSEASIQERRMERAAERNKYRNSSYLSTLESLVNHEFVPLDDDTAEK